MDRSREFAIDIDGDGDGSGNGRERRRHGSSSSFRRSSTLLRTNTRSRLMDPPPPPAAAACAGDGDGSQKFPSRGPTDRSGLLRPGAQEDDEDEDEDDPFLDEDLPDDPDSRRRGLRPLTFLLWAGLLLLLAALACSLSIPSLRRRAPWGLPLWRWAALLLALVSGRLASGWAVRVAVFLIECNFLLRKRVLYFVYGVRNAVQNCLWLGLVLVAWHYILERQTGKALAYATKALVCLLIATAMCLAKTLLVKVLASSFHVSTYFDRIQESLFNQYMIETLSGPPLIETQHTEHPGRPTVPTLPIKSLQNRESPGDRRQDEEGITIERLHKLNQKNVSVWKMKRLMKIVRHRRLSTLHDRIPQATGEDESSSEIRSEHEAKAAAKKIFDNVAGPGAKYVFLVDLMRFMREEEALKTMNLFEGAQENKRVSKRSLKNWVVNVFKERRALSLTLDDTKTAVNKLHQMANIVVGVIVFAICLLILDIASTNFFVLISSQLLLVAFVFGNTLKMVFEATIFLFVMHPFDVGDRCEVEGVQMIVEEMNILTTVFLRHDNQKIIYPNSVLSTVPISNIYRSPDMGDSIDFCVHVATPMEKLAAMKEKIMGFIEGKEEHWYPNPTVMIKDVDDMNRLRVSIWLRHRINHQDMGERWSRREPVVQEMIRVLRELDIEYRMLPHDVNVRCMPASPSTRFPSTWTACG